MLWVAGHAPDAGAQTVTALQDTTCAGFRDSNLNCSAGEFAVEATFQAAAGTTPYCVAGEQLTLDVDLVISGSNTLRYDPAFFVGQVGNQPNDATSGGICSAAVVPPALFPPGPSRWTDADGDACGDVLATQAPGNPPATPRVTGMKVMCQAASGSSLQVPYALTYSQNNVNNASCSAANVVNPKCTGGVATVQVGVNPVQVAGYVDVTKQTSPDGDGQAFGFTASSPDTTPSTTAFSLSDGQTQRVFLPVIGTARTLTIVEAATTHWETTANISCAGTVGSPVITTNGGTRTITVRLDAANAGAACTITNTKRSRVTLAKSVGGRIAANDQFTVSALAAGGGLTNAAGATIANPALVTTSGSATSASTTFYSTPGQGLTVADAMAAGSASAIGAYDSRLTCTNASAGPGATPAASLPNNLATASASITPAPGDDITCTYTNTPKARISLQKALGGAGRVSNTDQFALTIAGAGSPASVTTTGSGGAITSAAATLAGTAGATYALSEVAAGTANLALYSSSISCSNANAGSSTVLPSGAGSSFSLTPVNNDNISCVLTNTPRIRTLTVQKVLVPVGDPGQFVMNANGTPGLAGGDGATANAVVNVGSNATFAEIAAPGSDLGNYDSTFRCQRLDNGDEALSGAGVSGSFPMPDSDVVCVLRNVRKSRTVTVRKALVPVTDAGLFNLQINGSTVAANVGDGGAGSAVLPVGTTVTVAELAGSGTVLGDYTADLACPGATVTPGGGQVGTSGSFILPDSDIACTFSNTARRAQLTLVKQVVNDNGGTAVVSDFTLTANGTVFVTGIEQAVDAGTYLLAETGPGGYVSGAWSCTAGTLTGTSLVLGNGQSAVCTIVNDDAAASLSLVKQVVNDNGGTAVATDWTLSAAGPTPLSGAGGVVATAVAAGTYTLGESTGTAGYAAGAWSCTAGALTGTSLVLGNGQSAVCTIVNDDAAASLSLVKQVVNDNGGTAVATDWTLSATGPTPLSGAGGVVATAVAAGTYTLNESTGPAGYAAGAWSCTAGTLTGTSLVLGNGQSAVCTIVNDDAAASLSLVKQVVNDNGGTAVATDWTLSAAGATPLSGAGGVVATAVAAGTYTLSESTGPAGYAAGAWSCTAGTLTGTSLVLANGQSAVCTIVNDDILRVIAAVDDASTTPQNTPVRTAVLDNDTLDGNAIDPNWVAVAIATAPANGTVTVNADGTITYAPTPTFSGTDRYTYSFCEEANPDNCATATVTVTVQPNVVDAIDDSTQTEQQVPVAISVLGNDRTVSAPLDPISVTVSVTASASTAYAAAQVSTLSNGAVTCAAGVCTYTPAPQFAGTDSFSYRVCDISSPIPVCDTATVTISIIPNAAMLRISKQAAQREVKVGELVRYTVSVENIGDAPALGASLVDTLPAGFTYVDGSLVVDDDNDAGTLGGTQPLRVDGVDVAVGASATIVYTLRAGAGVGPGMHTNTVVAVDDIGTPISNVATADVLVVGDPLLDDSLIVGTVFDDRNGDGMQDAGEHGIPGVRIASVEGLVMETDAYGRYHLVGIDAGHSGRSRNFILKVDKATLPPGSTFTTENPRVRRITPGLPVRFDFGVKLPDGNTGGGKQEADVELGEVLFEAGSARVKPDYAPMFETIAGKVREYGGGRIVITANAEEEALAFARARAVQVAMTDKLEPGLASKLSVDVVTDITSGQSLVSLDKAINLGSVLFDTDKSTIKPQYRQLISQIAAELNRDGKGVIGIIGRADLRGSNSHNVQLGLRRAKAVREAIAAELSPEVRKNVRVDITEDTSAKTGVGSH